MKRVLHAFRNKKFLILFGIALMGVAVIGFSVIGNKKSQDTSQEVLTYSTDKPEEAKPNKDTYKWQGQPTDPKFITMPSINADGFIQKVGVDQNKQIAVPNNIHVAGWFNQSQLPGDKGLSIIDGHVTGRVNNGIFKDLGNLKKDDVFKIEFGNGTVREFKMVKSADKPVAESAAVLFSQEPGIERQVNLITCSGTFDKKINGYPNRLVVIASAL